MIRKSFRFNRSFLLSTFIVMGIAAAANAQQPPTDAPKPTDQTPPPADAAKPPTTDRTPPTLARSAPDGTAKRKERNRFRIGPEIGVFFPTSRHSRDAFGNTWTSFGIGLGAPQKFTKKGRIGLDLQSYSNSHNGNRAFLIPAGVNYRINIGDFGKGQAYAGVDADVLFTQLKVESEGVRSGIRVGGAGGTLLGLSYSNNLFIEARYLQTSKIRGFDLSGASVAVGFRF